MDDNFLTEAEYELLGKFLLERMDEATDTEDKDIGIMDVTELDGFFTAIVSSPATIMPSSWMKVVWGDFEPVWETQEEAKVGRNDSCPCGSGKKFKKCCLH